MERYPQVSDTFQPTTGTATGGLTFGGYPPPTMPGMQWVPPVGGGGFQLSGLSPETMLADEPARAGGEPGGLPSLPGLQFGDIISQYLSEHLNNVTQVMQLFGGLLSRPGNEGSGGQQGLEPPVWLGPFVGGARHGGVGGGGDDMPVVGARYHVITSLNGNTWVSNWVRAH